MKKAEEWLLRTFWMLETFCGEKPAYSAFFGWSFIRAGYFGGFFLCGILLNSMFIISAFLVFYERLFIALSDRLIYVYDKCVFHNI